MVLTNGRAGRPRVSCCQTACLIGSAAAVLLLVARPWIQGPPRTGNPRPLCRIRSIGGGVGPAVCSHKGVHAPWKAPVGSPVYPPLPGSPLLDSLRWHVQKLGVRCFDLDVSVSTDGAMLVGHPYDAQKQLRLPAVPGNMTAEALRAKDSDRGVLPLLGDVLSAAKRLGVRTLTLEPKHRLAEDPEALREFAAAAAAAARATPALHIYLILYDAAAAGRLGAEFSELRFAAGVRDSPAGSMQAACDGDPAAAAAALEHYQMLMPSLAAWRRCAPHLRQELRRRRVLVHTWTVDDASAVSAAQGSDAVITNVPAHVAHHCAELPDPGTG